MAEKPAPSAVTAIAETEDTNPWAGASMAPETANPINANFDPLNETAELSALNVGHFGLINPLKISVGAVREGYADSKRTALGQKPELTLASVLRGIEGMAYTAAADRLAESDLGEFRINDMRSFSPGGRNVNS